MSELEASMNQTASINIRRINQDSRDLRDSISSPSNQATTHLKKARILIEPEESEEMEVNMAQKRQFTASKQKSKLHYSTANLTKMFEVLDDFRMIYRARQIVSAMDTLHLHSEQIRRTALRVKIRSSYHLKKLAMRMVKKYLTSKEEKRGNLDKALEFRKQNQRKRQKKIIVFVRKLNDFEREWLFNVRYEIYFNELQAKIVSTLGENVKF